MVKKKEKPISDRLLKILFKLACRIATKLATTVSAYQNEIDFAEKFTKQLSLKSSEPTGMLTFILLNIDGSDKSDGLFLTPMELMKKMEKYYNTISYSTVTLKVPDSKMMERVAKNLVNMYGFKNVQGKRQINNLVVGLGRKRLKFAGRPSGYFMPKHFAMVRKIVLDSKLVATLIESLRPTKLVTKFYQLFVLGMFIVIKKGAAVHFLERLRLFMDEMKLSKSDWESFSHKVVSMSNSKLIALSKKIASMLEKDIFTIPYMPQLLIAYGLI